MVLLQYQNISIFKRINKTEIDFRFLFRYIYSINRHAAAQYSFGFLSTLDQLLPEKNCWHLTTLHSTKNTAITRTNKLMQKENTALLFTPISIIEKIIQKKKYELQMKDLRLKRQFY
jgi:hypothetical protein